MNKILLIISDEKSRTELSRIIKAGGFETSNVPFSAELEKKITEYDPDIILADASLIETNAGEIRKKFPKKTILAWMNTRNAQLAINLITNGAFDCLYPPIRYYDVLFILRHVLNKTIAKDNPIPLPKKNYWPIVLPVFGALLVPLVFLLYNAVSQLQFSNATTFFLTYQNPTGIFWNNKKLWVSDWYTQSIYQYNVGKELKLIKGYSFPDFNANSVAVINNLLWLGGTDGYIRCYKITNDVPSLINRFKAPGYSPSGLCAQGQYLWSTDAEANKIYQHLLANPQQIVATYNYPGLMPVGLYWDGKYFWSADGKGNKIYRHYAPERNFEIEEAFSIIPEGGGMVAGLSGDRNYKWFVFTSQPAKVMRYPNKMLRQQ